GGRGPAHGVAADHAAITDLAGEGGIVGTEQRRAHARVDAVGADDDVGLDLRAVLEAGHRDIVVRLHGGTPLAQRDTVGRQRGGDHVEQVRAVHGGPGQPVGGGLLGAADPGDGAAGAAVTGDEVL